MGIFSLSYQIGAMIQPNEEEATAFLEEFQEHIEDIDAVGIFLNNSTVSLPMFIPGFGIVWGLYSAWSTGFAFASIVSLTPQLAEIPPLAILYLSPFGIIELVVYSIAISRSYILIKIIVKKINLRLAIRPTLIEIGIALALLFFGGYLEILIIEID